MKRKVFSLVFIFLVLGFISFIFLKPTKESETKDIEKNKSSKSLSMMLETGSNTGIYEMTTRSTWPTDGYLFNSELSKCENGSKLSWNEENNTVVMTGNVSDKCYVYFDVYSLAVINSLTEEVTSSSIKLTVNATAGTKPITKYYYSKDNGTSYTESTSNTYTFSGLTNGTTYNIKVYVVDENGKSSAVYSKSVIATNPTLADVCSNGSNLASCIKTFANKGSEVTNIYIHNSSLTNGANDGSYRYAGSYETVNNYVCFGSDSATCPNDNLYRIIGVFGSQVKLIKADYANNNLLGTTGANNTNTYSVSSYSTYRGSLTSINRYYWTSASNNSNVWSGSTLNVTNLNGTYLTNLGTTWANKIATNIWKVGGNTIANIYLATAPNAYQNEIVSPAANTTYSAKIGLMHASDYGFAASPSAWTTNLYDYNSSIATTVNWMYLGLLEWTITRNTNHSYMAYNVNYNGSLSRSDVNNYYYAVRPTFYLNSNVTYTSGDGTKTLPIRVN